jgi:hypothetical protein
MDEHQLRDFVFTALGAASMCWSPRPTGVFKSEEAAEIGEMLMKNIKKYCDELNS